MRKVYAARTKRLKEIGIATYTDYLLSLNWQDRRDRYRREHTNDAGLFPCRYCTDAAIDVHHRRYDRLGEELDDDLEGLCREHHREVHRFGSIQPATAAQKRILKEHGYDEAVIARATFGASYDLIGKLSRGEVRSPLEFGRQ